MTPTLPKIEKGVPIPPAGSGIQPQKYPFRQMEVGDSFVIRAEPGVPFGATRRRVAQATYKYGLATNRRFVTRLQGDDTLRVWRAE